MKSSIKMIIKTTCKIWTNIYCKDFLQKDRPVHKSNYVVIGTIQSLLRSNADLQ